MGLPTCKFAALANVAAGAPFLPAAYHDADEPTFAIATEFRRLGSEGFFQCKNYSEGREH